MSEEKNVIPKPVISPLTDENGQQLVVSVGATSVPLMQRYTPAHQRKRDGVFKPVPELTEFTIDYSNPMLVAQLAVAAISACPEGPDRVQLTERIYGNWIATSSARAYVPDPSSPGDDAWDEKAMAKDLCQPRAQRKAGASIEDLRNEREAINAVLVPVLEWVFDITQGVEPNWTQVSELLGRTFNDPEQLLEYKMTLKENLSKLQAAIKIKEEAMAKAKASRTKKKSKAESAAEAAVPASAE